MPSTALFTPRELDRYRSALIQRLRTLRGELSADSDKLRRATIDAEDVIDRKDEADRAVAAGIADAEFSRDLDEAAQAQAALDRLAAGSFGRCVACAEPIARERLDVQPAASRCTACQAASERGAAAAARPA